MFTLITDDKFNHLWQLYQIERNNKIRNYYQDKIYRYFFVLLKSPVNSLLLLLLIRISKTNSSHKSNLANIISRLTLLIWAIALKWGFLLSSKGFWAKTKEDTEKLNRLHCGLYCFCQVLCAFYWYYELSCCRLIVKVCSIGLRSTHIFRAATFCMRLSWARGLKYSDYHLL